MKLIQCNDNNDKLVHACLTSARNCAGSQYRRDIRAKDSMNQQFEKQVLNYRAERLVALKAFHGPERLIDVFEWRAPILRDLAVHAKDETSVQNPPKPPWLKWKLGKANNEPLSKKKK